MQVINKIWISKLCETELEKWAEDKRELVSTYTLKEEIVLIFISLCMIGLFHKLFEDKNEVVLP